VLCAQDIIHGCGTKGALGQRLIKGLRFIQQEEVKMAGEEVSAYPYLSIPPLIVHLFRFRFGFCFFFAFVLVIG